MKQTILIAAIAGLLTASTSAAQLGTLEDPPHDPANGVLCTTCHVAHGTPGAGYDTVQGNINLCQSCHNPLGIASVLTHAPAGSELACSNCHNPMTQEQGFFHGSSFSNFIRFAVETPNSGLKPVILLGPSGPNSFADGDMVYDGICEVCHTSTSYHRNNPSGDHEHNKGTDCRQCHPHGHGYQPVGGGGDCLGCHNQVQPPGQGYRRQVVEFDGDGKGDFLRYSHHVDDGSGTQVVTAGDCTTCHDQSGHQSHPDPRVLLADADGGSPHLYTGSAASLTGFCLACHDADGQGGNLSVFTTGQTPDDIDAWWAASPSHASATLGPECWTCHQNGHGSDNPALSVALEESLCTACHDGTVATLNILAEFNKNYRHPIASQNLVHELGEDPFSMPRHVECEDCHNSHAADGSIVVNAPIIPGTLRGVSGIDTSGMIASPADFGYEVCYKCHADTNPGQPALARMLVETNARVEFDPNRPSFHPIEVKGRNPDVPSLIGGWTKDSVMTCQDCHAGNGGIAGPHGSTRRWILKKRYDTADFTRESAQAYALCYECHSRNSILNDVSFEEHKKHIEGEDTPCSVCHDAHGSRSTSQLAGTHLVNFRTGIVRPNERGQLYFRDDGRFRGSCSLKCHGEDHDDENYHP